MAEVEPLATVVDRATRPAVPASSRRLLGGHVLGRYVVVGLLGEGGMGQVYRGYDPKLRREVAVKLLSEGGGPAAVARLLREAQAMARLSHPNVVPVYDVEERDGRVFLAMELVEGQTLTEWLDEQRSSADILGLFVQAGRGLAAAHAVELVHRDFKPGNVMVGSDGRARVMDFGVARASSDVEHPQPEATGEDGVGPDPSLDSLSSPLTRAGVVVGTPAYMAPEQHRADTVDHRSDQYSFCVALYQALAGKRPFTAKGIRALYKAKMEQDPAPLEGVPRPVQLAVARGLAWDPDDRFASMDALLAELQRRPGTRARRTAVVGALGLTLVGGWGWSRWDAARQASACTAEAGAMDSGWNTQTRSAVREGIESTRLSYAPATADSTIAWLDDYSTSWSEAREQTCVRTNIEKTWDEATQARANWCLGMQRLEFDALTDRLSTAEPGDVESAAERAAGLGPVQMCLRERLLENVEVPPSKAQAPLRAILQTLSRANALIGANKTDEGLALAEDALSKALAISFGPVTAKAHLSIGDALDAKGKFEEAAASRKLAYFAAMEAGAMDLAGTAATVLIFSTGVNLAQDDDANDWYRHARLALRSAGADEEGVRLANAEFNLASMEFYAASVKEAKPRFERVLAVREASLGASHPQVARVLNMLASSNARLGETETARALFERTLEIQRTAYGDEHPSVATTLHNIATGLHIAGKFDEAGELYERSLAIRERSLRPDHPDIGLSLNNLAGIAWELGDKRKSLKISQRALGILESQYGPDHPRVANSLTGVAGTHVALGEEKAAIPLLRRAVAIYDEHPRGPKSNEPTARFELAKALVAAGGDRDDARRQAEKALALYQELGDEGASSAKSVRNFIAKMKRS